MFEFAPRKVEERHKKDELRRAAMRSSYLAFALHQFHKKISSCKLSFDDLVSVIFTCNRNMQYVAGQYRSYQKQIFRIMLHEEYLNKNFYSSMEIFFNDPEARIDISFDFVSTFTETRNYVLNCTGEEYKKFKDEF